MALEEPLLRWFTDALPHLPQHPANRFLDQVLLVVKQQLGHTQGFAEVAALEGLDETGVGGLNLGADGRFLPQAELRSRMARAAIYALPARYEPFGLSVLEAAAAGCALVLGDIASLRETWAGAALFVPPDDEAALGEALRRLIAAPAERARLAERALRRARALTAAAMAERTLGLYRSLRRPALRATA